MRRQERRWTCETASMTCCALPSGRQRPASRQVWRLFQTTHGAGAPHLWQDRAERQVACAGLTCTLRGYQRRALAWMAHREACLDEGPSEAGPPGSAVPECFAEARDVWNGTQHPSWQRIALPSGLPIYHNWNTGERVPPVTRLPPQPVAASSRPA